MFDIGISEIMLIAVVALVVLGPEKLPKTARTLGHLFGRLQRYVADVKADINRELELEELKKLQAQVQTAATSFESSMSTAATEIQAGVQAVETDLNAAAGSGAQTAAAPDALPPSPQTAPAASDALPRSPQTAPAARDAPDAPRQPSLPGFDRG
jgi:sec-independent protein translocase protein TatB